MFRTIFFLGGFFLLLVFLGPDFNSWGMLAAFILGALYGTSYRIRVKFSKTENTENTD